MSQHIRLIVKRHKVIDLEKLAAALLESVDRMNEAERQRSAKPVKSSTKEQEAGS